MSSASLITPTKSSAHQEDRPLFATEGDNDLFPKPKQETLPPLLQTVPPGAPLPAPPAEGAVDVYSDEEAFAHPESEPPESEPPESEPLFAIEGNNDLFPNPPKETLSPLAEAHMLAKRFRRPDLRGEDVAAVFTATNSLTWQTTKIMIKAILAIATKVGPNEALKVIRETMGWKGRE
jgi:hypothetical protein